MILHVMKYDVSIMTPHQWLLLVLKGMRKHKAQGLLDEAGEVAARNTLYDLDKPPCRQLKAHSYVKESRCLRSEDFLNSKKDIKSGYSEASTAKNVRGWDTFSQLKLKLRVDIRRSTLLLVCFCVAVQQRK